MCVCVCVYKVSKMTHSEQARATISARPDQPPRRGPVL